MNGQLGVEELIYGFNSWYTYSKYSIDDNTGDIIVSGLTDYHYPYNTGNYTYYVFDGGSSKPSTKNLGKISTLKRFRVVKGSAEYNSHIQESTMTFKRSEEKEIGDLLDVIIEKNNVYEDKQYVEDKYYEKSEELPKAYYSYKYENGEIKTIYNMQSKIINTNRIDLLKEREELKILIDATNTDYKLSISNDNTNWIEIDSSNLNGDNSIHLPQKWNNLYIRVKMNNSIINRILVK